jgi:hypothetical protein
LIASGALSCAEGPELSLEEARAIAKEAYTYGYPIIENYKVMYAYSLDEGGPEYKAPMNQLKNEARVYTPEDKAVVTPNSDTPYSFIVLDLRAEPMVLSVPEMEEGRYFSIQLIDLYTFNFDYIGTRVTGNGGGDFMIAGPDWKGEKPTGIEKVIPSETQLVLALYRTQLFSPDDMDNVKALQAAYKARPLSEFAGTGAPKDAPAVDWLPPTQGMSETVDLFRYLSFLLEFAPTHPSEEDLMKRFTRIGVDAGKPFDPDGLSPEMKEALEAGIADAWKDFDDLMKLMDAGEYDSGDMFGTREYLENNYLFRMGAAKVGLYGNSREEALYPLYFSDSDGRPLDASENRYRMRFEKDGLPPVRAFWSVTMYEGRTQLLVDNPVDRYLINSAMLESLDRAPDGSITLYIQKDSPGKRKESNWLPAPEGPFYLVLRLYLPGPEILDGEWQEPPVELVK